MTTGQYGTNSSTEVPISPVIQFVSSCQKLVRGGTHLKYLNFIHKVKESFWEKIKDWQIGVFYVVWIPSVNSL